MNALLRWFRRLFGDGYSRCHATTKKGDRCRYSSVHGSRYCYRHRLRVT
jgi:hypothetical protein